MTIPARPGRTTARATFRRHDSLGYQVNHLARLLAQALRARIGKHGVVPGQFAQLLALYEADGLTQTELCERVQIDQSTMAHTLRRMERDGLVQRSPDPGDRRQSRITLTDHAHEIRPALIQAALDVNTVASQGLRQQEIEACMRTLSTMIENLEHRDDDHWPDAPT